MLPGGCPIADGLHLGLPSWELRRVADNMILVRDINHLETWDDSLRNIRWKYIRHKRSITGKLL
jgi:hypothetical protein